MTRHSRNITIRRFAKQDLGRFAAWVRPQIVAADLNLAVITDTHDRTQWSRTFYGPNGLWHTQEQHWLAGELPIDWRVHLGDLVDGSEPNFLTMWRLRNLVNDYVADSVPFVIAKGNHDDNDKFAERNARFSGSFHPWVFNDLVYQPVAAQPAGPHITRHGLQWFDTPTVRVITLNTSDVPVRWQHGRKNYDVKKTLAVTAGQLQELADILATAATREVLIMAHAPAMVHQNRSGLRFNGQQLHELLRAFNAHTAGTLTAAGGTDFGGLVQFDFTAAQGGIIAYLAGHWHEEVNYRVNGILYAMLNCSALMGRYHALTSNYNRRQDRLLNTPSEYAGYIVSIDAQRRRLHLFGYGAASRHRLFEY
ncbi:metallophosphoesterase family protein [Lacticaseibacillus nasuensis]|uniref:metallophosphoesterase family protein n=1 Tax=Lacticaseibacillus nasuensis TaxID=944671 RepID=UPI002247E453|nr:metallophosphoesterase [Lacticaseibacillus nasuensis]MCX2454926.1 metallophosphoesterase [Lacticaseibacillus nasuensis]